MKTFRLRFSRSIGIALCTLMLLAPFSASAQWTDPGALVQRIIQILAQIRSYILENSGYVKEYVLDVAQKGIATNIEQRILDSAMEWARNGFYGQPSFIQNPMDLVSSTELNEANRLIGQINNVIDNVCQPMQITALYAPTESAQRSDDRSKRNGRELERLTECNLDDLVTSGSIENYYARGGYEEEGGLGPLMQSLANGSDNPYAFEDVLEEIQLARQKQAVEEAMSESLGGVLPQKVCVTWGPFGSCERAITNTPSSGVAGLLNKATGHSFDEISGQDEILESIFAGIVRRFTDEIIQRGWRI